MYIPKAFEVTDRDTLHAFIEAHSFATLITAFDGEPFATRLPLLLDREGANGTLIGHVARANPHWGCFDGNCNAVAMFDGPHAYISPNWYATSPAVPTWNYASVHAYGPARPIADAGWLRDFVRRLTERHEGQEPAPPWRMEDLPEAYVQSMLNGIVGIEISVTRLEGKFKLSQNRPASDRPRIIAALEGRGDADSKGVARLMHERELPD